MDIALVVPEPTAQWLGLGRLALWRVFIFQVLQQSRLSARAGEGLRLLSNSRGTWFILSQVTLGSGEENVGEDDSSGDRSLSFGACLGSTPRAVF